MFERALSGEPQRINDKYIVTITYRWEITYYDFSFDTLTSSLCIVTFKGHLLNTFSIVNKSVISGSRCSPAILGSS